MSTLTQIGLLPLVLLSATVFGAGARNPPANTDIHGEGHAAPAIVIHAGRTADPIHPFIYGQFIEHLGRCIYGGIWAEMLEDRKFYFPITPVYDPYRPVRGIEKDARFPVVGASPWEIVGPADSVVMTAADVFVGRHTPLIQPGGGIAQHDLGLVKGKLFVGHIWLKPEGGDASVEATLMWGEGSDDASSQTVRIVTPAGGYARHTLAFTAGASTDHASLIIRVTDRPCRVGAVSLMPGDNILGFRADTLALLKRLNAPMYRWPGGNFVSGYDWRDGIGPRDRRPPRKNPAWTGVEHNDVGIDEFIAFCREVNAEPLIAVNTGFGDAYSAAQEVEYCNGGPDTIGGGWRVRNGHPAPYGVQWWCVGNEMYGKWQLGHMSLGHYTLKHNEVVEYMRRADPSIKLIAVGDTGEWSEGMLKDCSHAMDLISEHFYVNKALDDVAAHIGQITGHIRRKAEAHREYRTRLPHLGDRDIRIAMDEWNYWYRDYVYGELGCVYRLRDALGIAAGLHEFARNTDIISMAHYAQTVNVIGCIKTTKTEALFDATALPLMLYRREFGTLPVAVTGITDLQGMDIAAAWTADRTVLTLGIVNPHAQRRTVKVNVNDATPAETGRIWRIHGPDPLAFNEPGHPSRVDIQEEPFAFHGVVEALPFSVTLIRLPATPRPSAP